MAIPEPNDDRGGSGGSDAAGGGLAGENEPTQQLDLSTVGERCVACGTPMSSDQRYCVNCGERRAKPRFTLSEATPPIAAVPVARRSRRPRSGSGATLIAGIGTLLLAMGVGVLIGRTNSGKSTTAAAPSYKIITVGGGAGQVAAAAPSSPSTNSGKKSKTQSKSKSRSKSHPQPAAGANPSAAVAAKANAAASKVLGGKNLPPATVTVGQKGTGPGYSKGKFTGTFFGQ